jgi:phage tail-like protein
MPASTDEILVGCRFYLEADGLTDKQILEVSGLSSENPAAGGDKVLGSTKNAVNLRQAAPTRVKFQPVTIKYVATTNTDFYKWYSDCNKNSGGKSDWTKMRKAMSVSVYDQAGEMKARWEMQNCYPTKYEGPKLEAGGSDVASETITCVHTSIERVQ